MMRNRERHGEPVEDGEVERLFAALDPPATHLPRSITPGVMARVRAERDPWWRRLFGHRAVGPRPALAVLTVAALGVVLVQLTLGPAPSTTRFAFEAPGARQVAVTGDFANWDPRGIPLERRGDLWTVELEIAPGVHQYVFIVDGREWRPDPNAAAINDGFGSQNSLLLVPRRGTG